MEHFFKTVISAEEHAAMKLAEAQHAPGVSQKLGSDYRVHYIRPDGTEVPGFEYFLRMEYSTVAAV